MTSVELVRAHAYTTPFGPLSVFVTPADGVVRAAGFRSLGEIAQKLPPALMGGGWTPGEIPSITQAVEAWLAGDGTAVTTVPAQQEGGVFFQEVWRVMREIPEGETATYAELAALAGRPLAVRAAGTACARNNLAPFVPCHRVVKTGGALGNYGYGLDAKAAMLALEAGTPVPALAR